jgi:hypothetical protein
VSERSIEGIRGIDFDGTEVLANNWTCRFRTTRETIEITVQPSDCNREDRHRLIEAWLGHFPFKRFVFSLYCTSSWIHNTALITKPTMNLVRGMGFIPYIFQKMEWFPTILLFSLE